MYPHLSISHATVVLVLVQPRTGYEGPEEKQRYSFTLSLISALDGGRWLTSRPGRFIPGNDPVPIVYEAGWAIAENLASTWFRSSDHPVRSLVAIPTALLQPHCCW